MLLMCISRFSSFLVMGVILILGRLVVCCVLSVVVRVLLFLMSMFVRKLLVCD